MDQPRPRAGAFGRSGDPDTTLGVSRLEVRESFTRILTGSDAVDTSASPTDRLRMEQLHAHIQHEGGAFLALGLASVKERSTDAPLFVGNLVATVGYRFAGYWMGGAIRRGVSVKLGAGVSPWTSRTDDTAARLRELNRLADHQPFATATMAHDRPVLVGAEGRLELIGCRGAYGRLRADLLVWRPTIDGVPRNDDRSDAVVVAPMLAAIGAYLKPRVLLEFQYGIELRSDAAPGVSSRDPATPFSFELSHVTSFRLYAEFQPHHHHVHLGAFAGALGGTRSGWQLGWSLAVDLGGDYASGDTFE